MQRFWIFFVNKTAFSYLLIFALILLGVFSLVVIPKESNPEVQIPVALVSTTLSGASALDVEKLVTKEVERALANNLDDINTLTSTSREGVSVVAIEFNASADIDKSIQDTRDEVDKVKSEIPEEANDPVVSEINFVDEPVMIISVSGELPPVEFIQLAEDIADELEGVRGVSRVEVSGVPEREVQVIVEQEKLVSFGINLGDVVAALAAANSNIPVGSIEMRGVEYAIRFEGDIEKTEEIGDIALFGREGHAVYIRDIAFVSDGVEKARTLSRLSLAGAPSERSLTLEVFKRSGGDITKIAESLREKLGSLERTLLSDTTYVISFDSGEFVKQDLGNLIVSGAQTVLFVILVLLLTLGWRESFIAGLAIPLSFVVAFIGLYATGNTINFVSLFALILSIGILVDSAIVVTEGMHTRLRSGLSKKQAAIATIKDFHMPLTAGTMTTVAVFVPLFFLSGVTGQFISVIPFTVIAVLLASLLVALGMIPLISETFLCPKEASRFELAQERYTRKAQRWYKGTLDGLLGNRRKENTFMVGIILMLVITISFPVTGVVKAIFFSQSDVDFLYVEIEEPQGTVLGKTDLAARAVEEILYDVDDVESFVTTVGAGSNFGNGIAGEKYANITINLDKERERASTEILEELRSKFVVIQDAEVRVFQPNNGPPGGSPIVIKFFGDDLDDLDIAATEGERLLRDISGAVQVSASTKNNATDLLLTVDREKATEVGVSPSQIAQTLRTAVYGTTATTIKKQEGDIDVVVKLNLNPNYIHAHDTTRTDIDTILQLEIVTPQGPVLLGSLLEAGIDRGNSVISHEDEQRIATVSSDIEGTVTVKEIITEFEKRASAELELPDGVVMRIGGENEDINRSFMEMFQALIAGVLLILAILVLQFNSFRYSLFIVTVVPLTLIGIFTGLAATGKTLSFPSMMGFIALSGIVVNNSIILIDVMNKLRREKPRRPVREIVIEGAAMRLRPIILTTVTTITGIFPLTYASEIWGPLAWSVIFGLMFAVVLTLMLIPMIYNRWPGVIVDET